MQTIHFTDLKEFAERDHIERGARYLHCHDGRRRPVVYLSDDDHFVGDAHCYEELTLTPIVVRRADHEEKFTRHHDSDDPFWSHEHPFFQTLTRSNIRGYGWWKQWHYASDSGLWGVEGVDYHNKSNYMLNVNALLRQGIIIGTERI